MGVNIKNNQALMKQKTNTIQNFCKTKLILCKHKTAKDLVRYNKKKRGKVQITNKKKLSKKIIKL